MKLGKKTRLWSVISGMVLLIIIYFTLLSFSVKPETKLPVYAATTETAPSCVEITGIHVRPVLGLVAIDLSWVKTKGAGKMIAVHTGLVTRYIQPNVTSTYSDLLPYQGSVTITIFSGTETNECFSVTIPVETNLPD